MRSSILLPCVVALSGCYHFSFEQRAAPRSSTPVITHRIRAPTYLNGFVGTGRVDTDRYCADPVRTELRVTAMDVLLSVVTLLIYTPHTLYVTCEVGAAARAPHDRPPAGT